MEVSDYVFPDAPMIARLRERERRQVLLPVQAVGRYVPATVEERQRLDAIRRDHPFPDEPDEHGMW